MAGVVTDVLDLCNPAHQAALGTSIQELTGNWAVPGPLPPPTQVLGRAAFDSKVIAGLQYPSAKSAAGINLVVFRDRLVPGGSSWLEVGPPLAARIP